MKFYNSSRSSWSWSWSWMILLSFTSAASTFDYILESSISLMKIASVSTGLSSPDSEPPQQLNPSAIEEEESSSYVLVEKINDSSSDSHVEVEQDKKVATPLFDFLSQDIFAYLTDFIINEESANLHLKGLVQKIPKFYLILVKLSSLEEFPLHLINCFGYFSPQEILFLHQLTPEICHAHRNKKLESFLETKKEIIPNFYDNVLIQLFDKSKYFQQVLKNMEDRSFSWNTRTQFVQKYHVSCLKSNYASIIQKSLVCIISKYHVNADFISLVLKNFTENSKPFLTGLMLSTSGQYNAVSTFLEKVEANPEEREKVFEGFLSANSGPFTDEVLKEIKSRNILLKSKFTFLLQNDIFTLGNLLQFGSVSDIDSIDPQKYLNFFADWDPQKYSKYILLIVWRRPKLVEAWRRLYEKFTVKNDFVTALFAPELFLNYSNLSVNLLAQKIMFIRSDLPPTPNSLSFIDKFRSSVKSHVLEHFEWIAVDSQDLLPYSVYCDLFEDCSVKHDMATLKPLVKTMLKFSKWMENGIRDNFLFHHKYLQLTKPTNNPAYEILFLYSIFLNDQKAFQIVRASFQYDEKAALKTVYCPFQYDPNESKFKFYSGFLEWRRVPAAYMGRFLMAWSGASESDLNVVLSLDSVNWNKNNLFGQDSARNYLFKLLRFFYFQTTTDISLKKDRCSPILVDEIKNVDLWYFYLKYNETSFRKVCKDFEFRFNQLPELKLY